MTDSNIPKEWNGVPTKYKFGDGFSRAGIGMRCLYVLGSAAMPYSFGTTAIVPIMMEINRRNDSKHAAQDAEAALQQGQNGSSSVSERKLTLSLQKTSQPEINPDAPENGKFQASLQNQTSQQVER